MHAAPDVLFLEAGGALPPASFDRRELKLKLIDNPQFKHFLEMAPEVREVIKDFYDSHPGQLRGRNDPKGFPRFLPNTGREDYSKNKD